MVRIKCSLCGYVFETAGAAPACGGCPLSKKCAGARCPNWGYAAALLRRRRGWGWRRRPCAGDAAGLGPFPLTALPKGGRGRVVRLDTSDRLRLQKLLSLGVLPGVQVEVAQRFPCFVLNVGLAQVALDATTAAAVYVTAEDAD